MDHIRAEREQLDHQRTRIEQILAQEIVSPAMQENLQKMLGDIARRMQSMQSTWGGTQAAPSRPQTQ